MAIQFGKAFFRVPDLVHCLSSCSSSQVLFQYSSFNIQYFCVLNEPSPCDHKGTCLPGLRWERHIPRSTGNMLKEMQNILHGKRTLRQDSVGVIYLEEVLGADREGLSVLWQWDMFCSLLEMVWFGWVIILVKGERKFMGLKGRLVTWGILNENILHFWGVMLF